MLSLESLHANVFTAGARHYDMTLTSCARDKISMASDRPPPPKKIFRCLILMQKNAKFFGGGGTALSPVPSPIGEEDTPSPHPTPSAPRS